MDQQAKQQIAERLKTANNVLITVSTNPSVDQLAALIGFTLLLNKMGKHGTAVFSGDVPSTLEFLKPDETIEKTTDSLRDFIIALDKTKADKLRYKVENNVVRIFITPYRTSISEKDLDFSQGDFNVDVVVALGVLQQADLDAAITTHGRILHDATVISINIEDKGNLGTINWNEPLYSSLCELLVSLGEEIGPNLFDTQMATAFLTGIVAETKRFSNDKTSPHTMTVAARLMSMGANQQLIASKLDTEAAPEPSAKHRSRGRPPKMKAPDEEKDANPETTAKNEDKEEKEHDGSLRIDHTEREAEEELVKKLEADDEPPEDSKEPELPDEDEEKKDEKEDVDEPAGTSSSRMALEPPSRGSALTANTEPEHVHYDPSTDPLSLPSAQSPLLNRFAPATPNTLPALPSEVLSGSEEPVNETPAVSPPVPDTDHARDAVEEALQSGPPQTLEPIEALGAQPMDLGKAEPAPISEMPAPSPLPVSPATPPTIFPPLPPTSAPSPVPPLPPLTPFDPAPQSATPGFTMPPNLSIPPAPTTPPTNTTSPATPPPPVPPPMMPPAL